MLSILTTRIVTTTSWWQGTLWPTGPTWTVDNLTHIGDRRLSVIVPGLYSRTGLTCLRPIWLRSPGFSSCWPHPGCSWRTTKLSNLTFVPVHWTSTWWMSCGPTWGTSETTTCSLATSSCCSCSTSTTGNHAECRLQTLSCVTGSCRPTAKSICTTFLTRYLICAKGHTWSLGDRGICGSVTGSDINLRLAWKNMNVQSKV